MSATLKLLKDIRSELAVCLAWPASEAIRSRLNVAIMRGEDSTDEIGRLKRALADAISTFRDDDKTTLVSAERQEAWIAALNGTEEGSK